MKNFLGTVIGLIFGFLAGSLFMEAITGSSFYCVQVFGSDGSACPSKPNFAFWIGVLLVTVLFSLIGWLLTSDRKK